jgi:hypothetical protein
MIRRSLREMSCNHGVYFGDGCEACRIEEEKRKKKKKSTKKKANR